MNNTETLEAFFKAQHLMPEIGKDATAKIKTKSGYEFEYSYASYPVIIKAIRPVLKESGIILIEAVAVTDGRDILIIKAICVKTGEGFESLMILPETSDPQSRGSVLTYYRRYLVNGLFNLCPDDDIDGQTNTQGSQTPPQTSSQRQGGPKQVNVNLNPTPEEAAAYRVPFSKKHKGKTLDQMGGEEVYGFIDWLFDSSSQQGKDPGPQVQELKAMADIHFGTNSKIDQNDFNQQGPY